ncbi:MAG TPA: hypothetical protein VFY29_11875, partial [Terriglobia bacterium]|nr:hypothetical protein [Terriglobia bacterium]
RLERESAVERVRSENEIRGQLSQLQSMVEELCRRSPASSRELPEELFHLYTDLIDAELGEEAARDLVEQVRGELAADDLLDDALLETRVARLVESEIRVAGPIRVIPGTRRLVALVGPTGVGKTTTIAKIAALAAFQRSLRVGLITLDTFRIAAVDQLKTYSEIIGVPLRVVNDPQELPAAIESFKDRDLVLIDTAGRNPRELWDDSRLAQFFAESASIKKALVVSATTRPLDLKEIIDRYKVFDPSCLIFTKLDETSAHGSVVGETVRSGLPLAYVTIGQTVPWDIVKPESRQLVDLLIKPGHAGSWNQLVASAHRADPAPAARRSARKQTLPAARRQAH